MGWVGWIFYSNLTASVTEIRIGRGSKLDIEPEVPRKQNVPTMPIYAFRVLKDKQMEQDLNTEIN